MPFVRFLSKVAEGVSATLFFAMFALFIAGIAARYLFAAPITWGDELIMVIFIWLVFTTDALVIREREQVTFDAFYDSLGERGKRTSGLLAAVAVFGLFVVSLPIVLDYVRFLWRERTNALQWRLDWVYACIVVFWVAVILRAALKFGRLAGPGWRNAVAPVRPDERANILG